MTSLGLLQYSEISDNSAINSNVSETEKKKQTRHNITIKKRHDIHTNSGGNSNSGSNGTSSTNSNDNVQNMLKLINNSNGYESNDDDGTNLVDFNPPPRAQVSSKTIGSGSGSGSGSMGADTNMPLLNVPIDFEKPTTINQPPFDINSSENIAMAVKPRKYPAPMDSYEGFNTLPKTYASDYYKQYVPYFDQGSSSEQPHMNKNQMLEK